MGVEIGIFRGIFKSKLGCIWVVVIAIKSGVKAVVKLVPIISYMMYSCNDTAEVRGIVSYSRVVSYS